MPELSAHTRSSRGSREQRIVLEWRGSRTPPLHAGGRGRTATVAHHHQWTAQSTREQANSSAVGRTCRSGPFAFFFFNRQTTHEEAHTVEPIGSSQTRSALTIICHPSRLPDQRAREPAKYERAARLLSLRAAALTPRVRHAFFTCIVVCMCELVRTHVTGDRFQRVRADTLPLANHKSHFAYVTPAHAIQARHGEHFAAAVARIPSRRVVSSALAL